MIDNECRSDIKFENFLKPRLCKWPGQKMRRTVFLHYKLLCLLAVALWTCSLTFLNFRYQHVTYTLTLSSGKMNFYSALPEYCFVRLCWIYLPEGYQYPRRSYSRRLTRRINSRVYPRSLLCSKTNIYLQERMGILSQVLHIMMITQQGDSYLE